MMSVIWWKCTTVAKKALERIVVFFGYKFDIKKILLLFLIKNLVILHGMYSCVRVSNMVLWHYMDLSESKLIKFIFCIFTFITWMCVLYRNSPPPPQNKLPLAQVYLFHDYDIISCKFSRCHVSIRFLQYKDSRMYF